MTTLNPDDLIYSYIVGIKGSNSLLLIDDSVKDLTLDEINNRFVVTYSFLQSGLDVASLGY